MNAFSVLAAAYGFVGAFSQVAAKVSIKRKSGLSAFSAPSAVILDKEASLHLIDILSFAMIGVSFLLAIFAEFTSYTDWWTGVISNLPLIVVLFLWVLYTVVGQIHSPEYGNLTSPLVIEKWEFHEFHLFPILSIVVLPFVIIALIYQVIIVGVDAWFAAGLVIPQIVLAFTFVILERSSWIFLRQTRA